METAGLLCAIFARNYLLPTAVLVGVFALFTGMTFAGFVGYTLLGSFVLAAVVIFVGLVQTVIADRRG